MSKPDIYWPGASGKKYGYWITNIDAVFKDKPGNYIFAKETSPGSGRWLAVYIGQTSNLNQRLENHEKAKCAIRKGSTHIHAHTTDSKIKTIRLYEEADLIDQLAPVCNG